MMFSQRNSNIRRSMKRSDSKKENRLSGMSVTDDTIPEGKYRK